MEMNRCFFMSLYCVETFAAKYHRDANEILALFKKYHVFIMFQKEYKDLSVSMPDEVLGRVEHLLMDYNALPTVSDGPFEPHVDYNALKGALGGM